MAVSPAQCRGARGLLGMTQADLSEASGVSRRSITDFEASKASLMTNNAAAIRAALEKAGVEFIEENGGGAGVRLRKRKR